MECPKCGSSNVLIQREQTAQVGVGSNKVVVEQNPKKSKGCFYWLVIGFWWELSSGLCLDGLSHSSNARPRAE